MYALSFKTSIVLVPHQAVRFPMPKRFARHEDG